MLWLSGCDLTKYRQIGGGGLMFNNAFCQQPICSPSRASIMTGARPETINVIENYTDFREVNPDIVTLPQQLIKYGYQAVCVGKIFHGRYNDPEYSWSRRPVLPEIERVPTSGGYALPENIEKWQKNKAGTIEKYGAKCSSERFGQRTCI